MPAGWSAAAVPAQQWHWTAINDTGSVMLAGAIDNSGTSPLLISRDGGAAFVDSGAGNANWVNIRTSATGADIVAAQYGGNLLISHDTGTTWATVAGAQYQGKEYESTTMSADGTRICAAILNAQVFCSANGGTTFTNATLAGGGALTGGFRTLAASATAQIMVAGTQEGTAYLSTNGGATFAPLAVSVGGVAATGGFYRSGMSSDGNTIVLAGNTQFTAGSSGIYVSRDRGVTWTHSYTAIEDFTSISVSSTGNVILVTVSESAGGKLLMSTDGGATFAAVANPPGGETNWRTVSINPSATRAIAATGTFLTTTGHVYTFSGTLGTP
jgi:photosystem II stability/assembly factor-like uncharacterized protein